MPVVHASRSASMRNTSTAKCCQVSTLASCMRRPPLKRCCTDANMGCVRHTKGHTSRNIRGMCSRASPAVSVMRSTKPRLSASS